MTIPIKYKPCKGIGKAKDFQGCGTDVLKRTYGLGHSCGCYSSWLLNTPEGQEKLKKSTIQAKKTNEKKQKKDWEQKKKKMSISAYSNKHKKELQSNINKLARMIDALFYKDCVCCNIILSNTPQIDGAHYHSIGSDETLRFNLHNIHAASSHCNEYKPTHHTDYGKGLIARYGQIYYEYVEFTLKQHPLIKLSEQEIYDKKLLTNKLIRDFDTFQFMDAIQARDRLNEIIGIYNSRN